jgi:hypothetical protein
MGSTFVAGGITMWVLSSHFRHKAARIRSGELSAMSVIPTFAVVPPAGSHPMAAFGGLKLSF